jgi:hypothetical protein
MQPAEDEFLSATRFIVASCTIEWFKYSVQSSNAETNWVNRPADFNNEQIAEARTLFNTL